jgi:hypothetical protein
MSKSNKTVTEVTVALEYIAHTAATRAVWQAEKGVGLNAGATYVSRYVERGALEASAKAVSEGKLTWKDAECVVVVTGNKGTSARFGRESKCGAFVECIGTSGARGVLAKSIFGTKGTLEVLSVADFAKRAAKGQAFTFTRNADKQTFTGRILRNSIDADVIALAYGAKDGRLLVVDIETDKFNVHNAEVRGHVDGADESALALTDAVITAVAAGKATRKGNSVAKGKGKGKGK